MNALLVERIENSFLDFEIFWKDIEYDKNDVNVSKIYFFRFWKDDQNWVMKRIM